MSKLEQINKFLEENKFSTLIESQEYLVDILYELYINKNIPHDVGENLYIHIGNFHCINKNYDEMIKYYKMAIDKGNSEAMYQLGLYYRNKIKPIDDNDGGCMFFNQIYSRNEIL